MTKELKQANSWAAMSCANWNKNPVTRKLYREKYRAAAEAYWNSPGHQRLITRYKNGDNTINTYPWPYREAEFANWEESADKDTYSLISDQSGCVIKYPTSYCAWKIFEATGSWPQKKSRERLDARNWIQFLAEAGYTTVLGPSITPLMFHNYVGVLRAERDDSEFGLVVWLEFAGDTWATVSSYIDKKYKIWTVNLSDFQWVLIK